MIEYEIHPTAIIGPEATVGADVRIGPYSIVHNGVSIGKGTVIGSFCEIGWPTSLAKSAELTIGEHSVIRSHSILYAGSQIGKAFVTGHHVCVRENSTIGEGFQLGSRGDVQGDCVIGDHVRTHSDVHIGKLSVVGDCVWLYPEVLLTNDPDPPSDDWAGVRIGDFAVVAAKVLLMPGVSIGEDCVIAAGSVVARDIPPGKVAKGSPAKVVCDAAILRLHHDPGQKAYPWRRRFHRGYPERLVREWLRELDH
jgi:acetyltransferase-like isoleucine patch superfamily enzyme